MLLLLLACDDVIFGASIATNDTAIANPTYADVQAIWTDACVGCHSGEGAPEGLALDGNDPAVLVDVPSVEAPGWLLVASGAPEDSYLWLKLNDAQEDAGGRGGAMPPGVSLGDGDLGTIANWIEGL